MWPLNKLEIGYSHNVISHADSLAKKKKMGQQIQSSRRRDILTLSLKSTGSYASHNGDNSMPTAWNAGFSLYCPNPNQDNDFRKHEESQKTIYVLFFYCLVFIMTSKQNFKIGVLSIFIISFMSGGTRKVNDFAQELEMFALLWTHCRHRLMQSKLVLLLSMLLLLVFELCSFSYLFKCSHSCHHGSLWDWEVN